MLEIKDLNKNYGKVKAVNGLCLKIDEGEIFGFVGPNGAGKTTTLKIISTLLNPSSGEVLIDGENIFENTIGVRKKIGYMPDFFGVYDDLRVDEYLNFYADLSDVKSDRDTMVNDLLELVELSDKKEEFVDSLSRGMKQRLCLARALVHNPKLLILDEPASGLDPRARVQMKSILMELKNMGKTIIISSHILPELSEICSKIGIISNGKIIHYGSVDEINYEIHGHSPYEVRCINDLSIAKKALDELVNVEIVEIYNDKIRFRIDGDEQEYSHVLAYLVKSGVKVVSYRQIESDLEDIFMKVTQGEDNNE